MIDQPGMGASSCRRISRQTVDKATLRLLFNVAPAFTRPRSERATILVVEDDIATGEFIVRNAHFAWLLVATAAMARKPAPGRANKPNS